MRRALAALVVTVVAVWLLESYETRPPRTVNPNAPLGPDPTPRAIAPRTKAAEPTPTPRPDGVDGDSRTVTGPATITPFSVIQVQVTLTKGRLTDVVTVALTGDGPHTDAINARAEPILRREALRAGGAKGIDAVSGATYTTASWKQSLQATIDKAKGRD